MFDFYEILANAEQAVLDGITEAGGEYVSADACGLDYRAGKLYVTPDAIIAANSATLDYYGGFEYVDSEYVTTIGKYKIYSAESSRVMEAIETFFEKDEQIA